MWVETERWVDQEVLLLLLLRSLFSINMCQRRFFFPKKNGRVEDRDHDTCTKNVVSRTGRGSHSNSVRAPADAWWGQEPKRLSRQAALQTVYIYHVHGKRRSCLHVATNVP